MIRRLICLSLGWWSPSRIMFMEGQRTADDFAAGITGIQPKPRQLGLLDRWELWNFRRDPSALATLAGPPLPDDPELRANLLAMTGDSSEYDRLHPEEQADEGEEARR